MLMPMDQEYKLCRWSVLLTIVSKNNICDFVSLIASRFNSEENRSSLDKPASCDSSQENNSERMCSEWINITRKSKVQ